VHQHSSEPRPELGWMNPETTTLSYGRRRLVRQRPALWPDAGPDSAATRLWPGIDLECRMIPRLNPPQGPVPYTEAEEAALKSWAETAWAADGDSAPLAVVALGRGAGLDEPVLRQVKGCHVFRWCDFVVVHDPATRRHPVAVDPAWDWAVVGLVALSGPEGYLVSPSLTDRTSPTFIDDIAKSVWDSPEDAVALDCERLRATWIVHHLRCGTDAAVLLRAAGLTDFTSLDPFLDHVEWPGDEEAFRSLRGDW